MPEKIAVQNPTVLLVEHGETEFSAPGDDDRIHGVKYDLPLVPKGKAQAEKAANIIADYDVASLEHSPMLRSRQTAEIIGRKIGLAPKPNKGLTPWDSGFASGMTHGAAKDLVEYYVKNPTETIRSGQPYDDWWETYSSALRKKLTDAEKTPGKVHVLGVHSSEVSAAPAVLQGDPAMVLKQRLPRSGQIAALVKRGGQWKFQAEFP